MGKLASRRFLLAWLLFGCPVVVVASAQPPSTTSSGPLVVASAQSRRQNVGFLDDNGSGNARLVETTTFGEVKDLDSDADTSSNDSVDQHQISLKDSKPRTGTNYHLKASILTILMAALWSPLSSTLISDNYLDPHSLLAIRIVVSILYLLECACSSTRRYLSNSLGPAGFFEYIRQLKAEPPTIVWEIECYHYRQVWRKNGERSTHSREKVITHRARQTLPIEHWKDVTTLDTLERALKMRDVFTASNAPSATFLKTTLAKLFVLTNPAVRERYFVQETLFKEREGRYDRHYDFTRSIHLKDFRHKVSVVRTGLSDIAFASTLWFWLASCVGLTVPFRVWFSKHCQPAELTITKEIEG